jgi:hypothetical protein
MRQTTKKIGELKEIHNIGETAHSKRAPTSSSVLNLYTPPDPLTIIEAKVDVKPGNTLFHTWTG